MKLLSHSYVTDFDQTVKLLNLGNITRYDGSGTVNFNKCAEEFKKTYDILFCYDDHVYFKIKSRSQTLIHKINIMCISERNFIKKYLIVEDIYDILSSKFSNIKYNTEEEMFVIDNLEIRINFEKMYVYLNNSSKQYDFKLHGFFDDILTK